jgi:hypothetical protein
VCKARVTTCRRTRGHTRAGLENESAVSPEVGCTRIRLTVELSAAISVKVAERLKQRLGGRHWVQGGSKASPAGCRPRRHELRGSKTKLYKAKPRTCAHCLSPAVNFPVLTSDLGHP